MPGYSITRESGIAHLRMQRPNKSNALNAAFWNSLSKDIAGLDGSGEIRAMVLSAEGKTFCAGMDLAEFSNGFLDPNSPAAREAFYHLALSLQETFSCLERARFPVIAAIQGPCLGAGLELAAACDLRFATRDAIFRIEEINTGIMADVGALQRLPKILPEPVVKRMAILGTALTAEQAMSFGFVINILESPETALDAAMQAAKQVCEKAPIAIAGTKAAIHWARDHSTADSLEWSARTQSSLWSTHDIMAAITARQAKKPAQYEQLIEKKPSGKA